MTLLARVRKQHSLLVAPKAISHRPDLANRQHIYSSTAYGEPATSPLGDGYLDYATLYTVHPWVHKAVQKIVDQVAPLRVRVVDGDDEEIELHPLTELFAYINDSSSPALFWERWIIHKMLGGEALFELVGDKEPQELWQWQPDRFLVHPDLASPRYPRVAGYTIQSRLDGRAGGEDYFVDYQSAIHDRFYNPLNHWRGIAPVTAVREGVTIDLFAQQWSKRFLRGSARPDFAIVAPQGLTATERDRYLADFMVKHRGNENAHLPVVLEAGVTDIKTFSFAPKDIEWLQQREYSRDEVGAIFGVPDEIMGYGRDTYENFDTAIKVFWMLTCKPLTVHRDNLLTQFFTKVRPMLKPGERFDTDLGEISSLQDDILPKVQAAQTLYNMGVSFDRLDEVLGLGIGPIGDADMGRQPQPDPDTMPMDDDEDDEEEPAKALRTKSALVAATKQNHTSAMVAFFMPPASVAELVRLQGYLPLASSPVPANEFHMTLMMLGDAAELTAKRQTIEETLSTFAGAMSPITGNFNGLGRFQNLAGGVDALYVSFNSKALPEWRQMMLEVLRLAGVESPSDYGFIPHITLGYIPADAPTPRVYMPATSIFLDSLTLAWGDERLNFPLVVPNDEEVSADKGFFIPRGGITPDVVKALILQLDPDDDEKEQRIRMAVERRTQRGIRRAFDDMVDTLFPEGYGVVDPTFEADRIHRRFMEDQALYDAVSRGLQDGADLGVSVAVAQFENIGFGFDFTLVNVHAREWALHHTDEIMRQLGANTRAGVGQAVARWVDNGEPLDVLINDLEPFFGLRRAKQIAATETTRAYAEGNQIAYRESGVVQQTEWRTARDEIVAKCPYCSPMHGQRARLGQPWQHPTYGPIQIPAHVNCRCWPVGVIDENR